MSVEAKRIAGPDRVTVRRALLSVSDKSGLIELAGALAARGVELVSTGGTAKAIAAAGLAVTDVGTLTGFPEIMDGRVKTLHPKVHGGLLGVRDDPAHAAAMAEHGIAPIDLLVVNLYPFEATVRSGADWETGVENIDIGGPAMIRAAAKNHAYVAVVVDPSQYGDLLATLDETGGATTLKLRKSLAQQAFGRTAVYDAAVSNWIAERLGETTPRWRAIGGERADALRYGENPHQDAGFYRTGEARPGVATARQLQGKTLSYNNINDTDAAYELVAEFDPAETAAVAIIKHANPCGAAVGTTLRQAYLAALRSDPLSAFGGIVALNRTLDAEAAEEIVKIFTEVIIAPDATAEAQAIVAAKKNLRLLVAGGLPDPADKGLTLRSVAGGFLAQTRDYGRVGALELRTVTRRQPTAREFADLRMAFTVVKHVKSNAIVYVKNGATVGIGAGQMSRVDSAAMGRLKAADAATRAGEAAPLTIGSVAASDAFFPFPDGLETIVAAGATAVIQPGGSANDAAVIAAADEAGIAMVMTGMRHFRH